MSSDFKWVSQYKHISEQNDAERIAHFLDWTGKKYAEQFVPLNVIHKAIRGYAGRLAPMKSQDVKLLKKRMRKASQILEEQHGRFLVCKAHFGYRATVDDNDKMATTIVRREKAVVSSMKRLEDDMEMVDRKELTGHNRVHFDSTNKALLGAGDLIKRLTAGTAEIAAVPSVKKAG